MKELKKQRIKTVLKYTWPIYIIVALLIGLGLNLIFGLTHRLPYYRTLTLFVSGEVIEQKKLEDDIVTKYKDNGLSMFSCISAIPGESTYYQKLSVPGYNTADVLLIPTSILKDLNASAFALEVNESLITSYYSNYQIYSQENIKYGIELDKSKVEQYFALPNETIYMLLNAKSENMGEYGLNPDKSHNNALNLVKEWGKHV